MSTPRSSSPDSLPLPLQPAPCMHEVDSRLYLHALNTWYLEFTGSINARFYVSISTSTPRGRGPSDEPLSYCQVSKGKFGLGRFWSRRVSIALHPETRGRSASPAATRRRSKMATMGMGISILTSFLRRRGGRLGPSCPFGHTKNKLNCGRA